jgi:hypothetical protein
VSRGQSDQLRTSFAPAPHQLRTSSAPASHQLRNGADTFQPTAARGGADTTCGGADTAAGHSGAADTCGGADTAAGHSGAADTAAGHSPGVSHDWRRCAQHVLGAEEGAPVEEPMRSNAPQEAPRVNLFCLAMGLPASMKNWPPTENSEKMSHFARVRGTSCWRMRHSERLTRGGELKRLRPMNTAAPEAHPS